MHYLHKILVYIPDAVSVEDEMIREEKMDRIRSYADEQTSDFYGSVFDWRETDCAGRWSSEFPQNVIFAADDIDAFITQVELGISNQKRELASCLKYLKESVGTDLEGIIKGELECKTQYGESVNGFGVMTSYYLHIISSLLYGEYRSDSYIYNSHGYTARIFPEDIDSIRQEPENWALVMFDYHN